MCAYLELSYSILKVFDLRHLVDVTMDRFHQSPKPNSYGLWPRNSFTKFHLNFNSSYRMYQRTDSYPKFNWSHHPDRTYGTYTFRYLTETLGIIIKRLRKFVLDTMLTFKIGYRSSQKTAYSSPTANPGPAIKPYLTLSS